MIGQITMFTKGVGVEPALLFASGSPSKRKQRIENFSIGRIEQSSPSRSLWKQGPYYKRPVRERPKDEILGQGTRK